MLLERKVSLRPGHLLGKLLGIPGNEASPAASVVDYYQRRLRDFFL